MIVVHPVQIIMENMAHQVIKVIVKIISIRVQAVVLVVYVAMLVAVILTASRRVMIHQHKNYVNIMAVKMQAGTLMVVVQSFNVQKDVVSMTMVQRQHL